MRTIALAFFILFSFLFIHFAFAQSSCDPPFCIDLNPGDADFEVRPIALIDTPFDEGDYCGNPSEPGTLNRKLGLRATPGFLNIRWIAEDPAGIERNLGVDCWLVGSSCTVPAAVFVETPSVCSNEMCSFRGPTGEHACSIVDPDYEFNGENRVICRFFDLGDTTKTLESPDRKFKTADYVITVPPIAVTVGDDVRFPINVKSFGILPSFFTNNLTVLGNDGSVIVENGYKDTNKVTCGGITETIPLLKFLIAKNVVISILVHSSADEFSCSTSSQCAYLDNSPFTGVCQQNKCWSRSDIPINAAVTSLSEYNILGFVAIIVAAFAIILFSQRKKLKKL